MTTKNSMWIRYGLLLGGILGLACSPACGDDQQAFLEKISESNIQPLVTKSVDLSTTAETDVDTAGEFEGYYELGSTSGSGTIAQVQQTEPTPPSGEFGSSVTDAMQLSPLDGAPHLSTPESGYQNLPPQGGSVLPGEPVVESGPLDQGSFESSPITSVEQPIQPTPADLTPTALTPTPANMAVPSTTVPGARIIPDGCPRCECVVCQCGPGVCCPPSGCMPYCNPCPPMGNICGASKCCPPCWKRVETLIWGVQRDKFPTLLTTSPAGTPGTDAGILGLPTTEHLINDGTLDTGVGFGHRFTIGHWFNDCRTSGIEFQAWYLTAFDDRYRIDSDGDPIVARPFFNTDLGMQDAQLIAFPGLASGSFVADYDANMYSAAPMWRFNGKCRCVCRWGRPVVNRIDWLAGYRYWHFEEQLDLSETLFPEGPLFAPGTSYELVDRYRTRNDFHGGEVGVEWLRQRGRWVLDMSSRLALGQMRRRVDAVGTTRVVVPNVMDDTLPGGFYTTDNGIQIRDNKTVVIPQARIGLSFYIRPCWRFQIGYDFVYVPNVIRPSGVMDTAISGNTLVRPGGGGARFEDSSVWAQGFSIGSTFSF